jgi:hypothetical protein
VAKNTCASLLKNEKILTVIGIPVQMNTRVKTNRTQNDKRGVLLKARRAAVDPDVANEAKNSRNTKGASSEKLAPRDGTLDLGTNPEEQTFHAPANAQVLGAEATGLDEDCGIIENLGKLPNSGILPRITTSTASKLPET